MKKLILSAAMMLLASAASAATLKETIDQTIDVKPGANVVLTNVNGSITITSWDQPRVHIIAYKEVQASSDEAKDVLKELRVDIKPGNDGVTINTIYPKRNDGLGFFDWLLGHNVEANVRYEVTVPKTMNVDVTNTNGAVHLSDVTGKLGLETTNGRIEVARCAGAIEASTTNGSIHAELTQIIKGQPLEFETTNGRIEVSLPHDLAADIDAGTTNGSIHSDLPVTTRDFSRTSLRGTINGGGTPLRLHTTNGGITISTTTSNPSA
jgi:DUF4097 and DUF4098 domain-containing protein YvlB